MLSRRKFFGNTVTWGSGLMLAGKAGAINALSNDNDEAHMNRPGPVENVVATSDPEQVIFRKVEVSPAAVEVGNNEEFKIKITIGAGYAPQPTRIMISLPTQLGFSKPSLFIDEDYGYLEVYCNNPAVKWEKKLWDVQQDFFVDKKTDHPRKWGQHLVVLDLSAGLKEGDHIQLNWGDLGRGFGKGTQTTVLSLRENYTQYVWVRYFNDPQQGVPDMERDIKGLHQRPVPDAETKVGIRILPKPLHHWRLLRKADHALLLPLDIYGNITNVQNLGQEIETNESVKATRNGVYQYGNANVAIRTKKYPLSKGGAMSSVFEGMNIYFGDMHNHSTFSNDVTEESRTEMYPYDMQVFARDRAGLDFYATSEHHQPQDSPRDHIMQHVWEETMNAVIKNDKPGEFLVFPGFEYRCRRGDTVLFFNYLPEYKEINQPGWKDIRQVWDDLKGKDYISHPHFHNPGTLGDNEWWVCPYENVEPVIEIFSCHRSFERFDVFEQGRSLIKHRRTDRNGAWFMQQNYQYGFVANSDSHYGHPGMQGLAAVYAKQLDKPSILEAYRKRHVYGLSGDRIRLLFTGNGNLMGSMIANREAKEFLVDVVAENKLKKIELFRNGELYQLFIPQKELTFTQEVKVKDPDPSNWYVRVTQENNQMARSSAVWYT